MASLGEVIIGSPSGTAWIAGRVRSRERQRKSICRWIRCVGLDMFAGGEIL